MKKIALIFFVVIAVFAAGCASMNTTDNEAEHTETDALDLTRPIHPPEDLAHKRILVAFFSHAGENFEVGFIEKGNTHIVADQIAELTHADAVVEIRTVQPYPADYQDLTKAAKDEQMAQVRPPLSTRVEDMASYDVVYLGYPIWYQDLPMPVYTFLESYDFTGKTIIPFCTGMGSAMSGKEEDIPLFAKGAQLRAGLGLQGKFVQQHPEQAKLEIANWLATLGYTN